jgi:hypothetical protein
MKRLSRAALISLFSLFLLAGCVQYSLVPSDKMVTVGNTLQVEPQITWSKSESNGIVTWTADGPSLDRILFFPGIDDGAPLIKNTVKDKDEMPLFSSSMTPLEVMDLIKATLARMGCQDIQMEKIIPHPFDGLDGYKFFFSYASEGGLRYKGFSAGTVKNERLYLVIYTGTDLFYYDKYLAAAEKIVSSIKIL